MYCSPILWKYCSIFLEQHVSYLLPNISHLENASPDLETVSWTNCPCTCKSHGLQFSFGKDLWNVYELMSRLTRNGPISSKYSHCHLDTAISNVMTVPECIPVWNWWWCHNPIVGHFSYSSTSFWQCYSSHLQNLRLVQYVGFTG